MSEKSHYSETIEVHYPTTVIERVYQDVDSINTGLSQLVREWAAAYENSEDNAVRSGKITTEGGYQTSLKRNILELKHTAVEDFKAKILMPTVKHYLTTVFKDQANKIQPWAVGWANLLRSGNWQRPHFHPTERNLISGVYYVDVPENLPDPEGRIEFINPVPISVHHGFSTTRRLHPSPGKIILFPPYYMHFVHPFKSDRERIILAFDILGQRPGPSFVF